LQNLTKGKQQHAKSFVVAETLTNGVDFYGKFNWESQVCMNFQLACRATATQFQIYMQAWVSEGCFPGGGGAIVDFLGGQTWQISFYPLETKKTTLFLLKSL